MLIESLRVVDNRLPTPPDGETVGPTTYFMDVAVTELDTVAIPINQEAYMALTNITAAHEPPMGEPVPPTMGLPA